MTGLPEGRAELVDLHVFSRLQNHCCETSCSVYRPPSNRAYADGPFKSPNIDTLEQIKIWLMRQWVKLEKLMIILRAGELEDHRY